MAYNMKKSPINKGYASKPSPIKWLPLVKLLTTLGVKAATATKIGTAVSTFASSKAGQAAISGASSAAVQGVVNKANEKLDPNLSDPFGGIKMGV